MKIKTKVAYFFVLFFVASMSIMFFIGTTTAMKGYRILESERLNWEIERVKLGIENLIQMNELTLLDWVKWDDAYDYIKNPNDAFIKSNFSKGFYIDQSINYALIFNEENEVLFAQGYDYLNKSSIEVPTQLLLEGSLYPNSSGFLKINDETLVYTALKVTNTDESAKEQGLIVFATIVNQSLIDTLSEHLLMDLTWEFPIAIYTDINPIKITAFDNHTTLIVHVMYENFRGHVAISTEIPHDITQLGTETIRDTLIMFMISFLVLTLLMFLGINNGVSRISKLSEEVMTIHNTPDTKLRVISRGKDDIGILADNINDMLVQLEDKNKQILEYATFDALTGVLSRRMGFDRLNAAMELSKAKHLNLVICFIDVNDLKHVNDTLGHHIGDQYLKDISDILMNNTRNTDVVCRLGGDEFLIVFHHCKIEEALATMIRIEDDIDLHTKQTNTPYQMSISKGLVQYQPSMTLTSFVELADKKMYEDKKRIKALGS
jgi:diguanylate cyclase (GGDEF)-like protein